MLLNQHERQVVSEAKIVCGRFHVFDESVTALAKAIGHCGIAIHPRFDELWLLLR